MGGGGNGGLGRGGGREESQFKEDKLSDAVHCSLVFIFCLFVFVGKVLLALNFS